MPRPPVDLVGSFRHEGYYDAPVHENPLTLRVVLALSAEAKKIAGSKRCSLFATGAKASETLWAIAREGGTKQLDLDLSGVFPQGCYSVRVSRVPATNVPLPSAWRIYFDTGRYPAPVNEAVMKRFGTKWTGNILLVKHRRKSNLLANVTAGEQDYADLVLSMWLREFASVRQRLNARIPYAFVDA
ncbi:hypothetical protein B0H11DRAFT_2226915 [Mycena galericulata]|nr:hypothetical protein B0H11DRAFT_2226915 [Mycena galericulata]